MEGVTVQKEMYNQKSVGRPALSHGPIFLTAMRQGPCQGLNTWQAFKRH